MPRPLDNQVSREPGTGGGGRISRLGLRGGFPHLRRVKQCDTPLGARPAKDRTLRKPRLSILRRLLFVRDSRRDGVDDVRGIAIPRHSTKIERVGAFVVVARQRHHAVFAVDIENLALFKK